MWVLLKFRANYADEFDCESIVITTRKRWERAQEVLRAAYPGGSFNAGFGTNESINFTAESFIKSFEVWDVSVEVARGLVPALGLVTVTHARRGVQVVSRSWWMLIGHGVLPHVPDIGELKDWRILLAFPIPPQRCAAHGNVIGECDKGMPPENMPWAPPCWRDRMPTTYDPDPDYEALNFDSSELRLK